MKRRPAAQLFGVAAVVLATAFGCASVAIEDTQMGLNKTSVFDVVRPVPFNFDTPGASQTIAPLLGSGIPPMISHPVEEHLPLTTQSNDCLSCHDKPQNIGKPVATGKARPAPSSHYTSAAGGAMTLVGAKYNCMSCHAPQAEVPLLVRNNSQ
jgi:nitrate reductase (cytochrome), electron transfer subunit